ncbi:MAG: hypothetical protein RMJ39_10015 [Deltaproteobacteria bacterium]|nr:hypothetical protein [Deltaproteobacteria bacterium]
MEIKKVKDGGANRIIKIQGEVYFVKTDRLPLSTKYLPPMYGRYSLGKREGAGYSHVCEDVKNATLHEAYGHLYICVYSPVSIIHQEHKPIILEPGIWRIGIQRVYDYFDPFDNYEDDNYED